MAAKPYSVSFTGDFTSMVRDAQKASSKLTDIFKDAAEKGFKNTNLRGIQQKTEKIVKEEYKLRQQLELRLERQRAEAEGRLDKEREKAFKRILLKQKEMDEAQDDETKSRLKAEYEIEKIRAGIWAEGEEFNRETEKTTEALRDVLSELKGAEKAAKRSSYYFDRTAERMGKVSKFFRNDMEKGADTFVDKITGGLDGLMSKLTSSVDMGSLAKGLGGGASKGIQAFGDMLGTLGKIGPVLAGVAGALAGVVAGFGLFMGLMFDMDKKVKEFNKSAINTFGALSLVRAGAGNLEQGLKTLNHVVTNLTATMGMSQEEAMGLFDALDKGGVTLNRITGDTNNTIAAQDALTRRLTTLATTAKMVGVSVSEYASNLTDYVNDLGMSLDSVNTSFAAITDMANKASFGTRRFYSMVVQATSGQSSLNVRLDQTAELLMRMTKILGQKKAAEMVGSHTNDLAGMSGQERIRMSLIGGRSAGRRAGIEARSQATSFSVDAAKQTEAIGKALQRAHLGPEIAQAISAAGAAGTSGDATRAGQTSDQLVKLLSRMPQQQQAAFIAAMQADPATVDMGRQLSQLIDLARASNGSLGNVVNSFGAFSAGGSMALRLDTVQQMVGRLENINDPAQRVAAENITGLSGAAYDALRESSRVVAGQFANLRDMIGEEGAEDRATQMRTAEQYGAAINNGQIVAARVITDRNGNKTVQLGNQIEQANDLLETYMERSSIDLTSIRDEQKQVAWDTYNATVSLGDILENKILYYLRGIYEDVGLPIIKAMAKYLNIGGEGQRDMASEVMQNLTKQIASTMDTASSAQRKLATTNTLLGSTTDPTKRADLTRQKKALEEQLIAANARIETMRTSRSSLAQGDYSALGAKQREQGFGVQGHHGVFKTRQEAETYSRAHGLGPVQENHVEEGAATAASVTQSITDAARNSGLRSVFQNRAANGAASVAPTATPTSAPSPHAAAPVAVAPSSADTNPVATATVTNTVTAAAATATQAATATNTENQRAADQRHRQGQQHLTRMLTRETKLGDALARSRLPDAIVEAQLKQEMMAMGTAAGLDPEHASAAAAKFLEDGTLNEDLRAGLVQHTELAGAAMHAGIGAQQLATQGSRYRMARQADVAEESGVEDFIYRGNGVRGSITPIDTSDQFFGARPGGAIDKAVGSGGGSPVNIHIHGGDERRVFDVVKRVLRQSGVGPTRMGSSA